MSEAPGPDSAPAAPPAPPSRRRLAAATAVALLVASLLLLAVVMPAEYGVDPLGTGELLGLTGLSGGAPAVRSDALAAHPESYRVDRRTFELAPGAFVEYKLRLGEGDAMLYSWTATDSVRSEMHSEEDGAPEGTAEFFEVEESTAGRHGSYVAPFPGIHGWYWLNETDDTVRVTLHAAGFFDEGLEFVEESALPWRYPLRTTPAERDTTERDSTERDPSSDASERGSE